KRRLAVLELGDVAVEPEQLAVAERLEVELDVFSALRAPLVADAVRPGQARDQLLDLGVHVLDRSIFAALDLKADDLAHVGARCASPSASVAWQGCSRAPTTCRRSALPCLRARFARRAWRAPARSERCARRIRRSRPDIRSSRRVGTRILAGASSRRRRRRTG